MPEKTFDEIRRGECEYLRTELPSRLRAITELLLRGEFPSESAWCGTLILKLMQSVEHVGRDLLAATESPEALAAVAWNARNMVELRIWVRYCGSSEQNARRFYEDALRDMKGLVLSLSKMNKYIGRAYEQEQAAHEMIDQLAKTTLGLESIGAEFESVANAAKAVGLSEWYLPVNKYLSKLAHPTALLVIGIKHQTERLRDMQSGCLAHGSFAARQCECDLEQIVRALIAGSVREC